MIRIISVIFRKLLLFFTKISHSGGCFFTKNCYHKWDRNIITRCVKVMKDIYMNRELSWLKFNERVLEEAADDKVPLCERMSFASIYQSNLDEFFMVRVGSLMDQKILDKGLRDNKTNMTAQEQIDAILKKVQKMNRVRDSIFAELSEKIEDYGIHLTNFRKLTKEDVQILEMYFDSEIAPLVSPTIVGKRQPFPFLKNKEIYAVVILETKNKKERMGIIPCTSNIFGRLIEIPTKPGYFILSEEIILYFIAKVFKGYTVKAKSLIRVTRNADIDADALYDEDLDYREFMAELIKRRRKLSPVRLELSREMDGDVVDILCKYLDMERSHVFSSDSPLDFSFIPAISDRLRKHSELFFEKRVPQRSHRFDESRSIIEQIKEGDKLLSYPYESIRPFLNLLNEAAQDKSVVSIKMTLYRLARHSKVVEALIEAAENGKEVVVLVELRARFDEENNIEWSRRLEAAGCQVIYGLESYKVHSKLCLITRKCEGQIEYITQVGTGNYNESTARVYTDLSLMTANVDIGLEAAGVFQCLAKGEFVEQTEHLLVAPKCLQNKIIEMIDEEIHHAKAGEDAYVGLKLNSLTDKKIIDKLIEASGAGVKIDMVIRGICCLIPGIEGATANIRVRSIVGRFLEHSRIYIFGCGGREKYYISSADFMTRNTVHRVEVAAPVYDPELKMELGEMFITLLSDNQKARQEDSNGNYYLSSEGESPLNAQEEFYAQAYRQCQD